jgi:hypothetical protein
VDAWRSPKRVIDAHSPDQRANSVSICGRPPRGHDFQRQ